MVIIGGRALFHGIFINTCKKGLKFKTEHTFSFKSMDEPTHLLGVTFNVTFNLTFNVRHIEDHQVLKHESSATSSCLFRYTSL